MKKLLLGVVLALSAISASAQVYVGTGVNYLSPFVGYRFGKHLMVEGGYVKPRDTTADGFSWVPHSLPPVGGQDLTNTQDTWRVDGWRLSAIGALPLYDKGGESFAILGRASMYKLSGELTQGFTTTRQFTCPAVNAQGNCINPIPSQTIGQGSAVSEQKDTVGGLALGVEWRLGERVSLRGFYEKVSTSLSADGKINMSVLELTYTF